MSHAALSSKIRQYGNKFGAHKLPIFVGFMVVLLGAWDVVTGLAGAWEGDTYTPGVVQDREQTGACMVLVGGLFLFFTGLWFMTRAHVNQRGIMGLLVMLFGIFGGTWGGRFLTARSSDGDFASATIVFLAGLLVHLLGVLYVKNE